MDKLIVAHGLELVPRRYEIVRHPGRAYSRCVAEYFDAEVPEENFGDGSKRDSSGSFTGAGALENVSGIGMVVFKRPSEIGMSGPGTRQPPFGCRVAGNLASRHDFFPIRPVPVFDHHGDGAADGLSVPHPGEKTHLVLLDFHPAAAAITTLPPFQLMIDEFEIDGDMGRKAFDERDQGLTMRLAGRSEAQHGSSIS